MYFFIGLYNYIMHVLFYYPNEIDKFVVVFLLADLMIVSLIQIGKSIMYYYHVIQNLIDQMNDHLREREKIIESVRKAFAFDHIKAAYYNILYLHSINVEEPIKGIKDQLITFGVDPEILNDDAKFTKFLVDVGQEKYQIKVDSQNKKFIFTKLEEEQQNAEIQS